MRIQYGLIEKTQITNMQALNGKPTEANLDVSGVPVSKLTHIQHLARSCIDLPYRHGLRHLALAVHTGSAKNEGRPLLERSIHLFLGAAELLPVMNIVVSFIDRYFMDGSKVQKDKIPSVASDKDIEEWEKNLKSKDFWSEKNLQSSYSALIEAYSTLCEDLCIVPETFEEIERSELSHKDYSKGITLAMKMKNAKKKLDGLIDKP